MDTWTIYCGLLYTKVPTGNWPISIQSFLHASNFLLVIGPQVLALVCMHSCSSDPFPESSLFASYTYLLLLKRAPGPQRWSIRSKAIIKRNKCWWPLSEGVLALYTDMIAIAGLVSCTFLEYGTDNYTSPIWEQSPIEFCGLFVWVFAWLNHIRNNDDQTMVSLKNL